MEWCGKLGDRCLAQGKPRKNGAACRVGKGSEGAAESVGRHFDKPVL
jgi:hypothetical protein